MDYEGCQNCINNLQKSKVILYNPDNIEYGGGGKISRKFFEGKLSSLFTHGLWQ